MASPPPGIEEGGIWGTNKYIGTTTQGAACLGCLCLGVPGCIALCFPCDERDAYKVKGKVSKKNETKIAFVRSHSILNIPKKTL